MGGQGRKTIIPLFSPKRYRKRCREPKPLPLGEVALRSNDGEGKPGRKEPLRSDGQALCQSDAIAVPELFVSGLALSVSSQAPRQLPQRGSHWHVGQLSSGRAKHNISEAAVLRCLGQRQLDKERCPEAAAPVSKARPLASCRASGVQWKVIRPAKASPFGRGVTEGDGEGKPGRKEPQAQRWAGSLSERYYRSVWDSPSASLPSQSGLRPPALPEGEPLTESPP